MDPKHEKMLVERAVAVMEDHAKVAERYDSVRSREVHVCACGTQHPPYDNGRFPTHQAHVAGEIVKDLAGAGFLAV